MFIEFVPSYERVFMCTSAKLILNPFVYFTHEFDANLVLLQNDQNAGQRNALFKYLTEFC